MGENKPASAALRFGPFALDPANAVLQRGEARLELPPKAFAVLCHLATRPGRLVTKDELLDAVWGRRFVSESVIKTAVNAIRAALEDDPRAPRYVETVARRGYRFLHAAGAASVTPAADAAVVPTPAAEAISAASLVGRDDALAQLDAWLSMSAAGQPMLVWVGGEAGIGKTTLIDRFCAAARVSGAWVARGQCVEQTGGGEPYLPVLDALAELARGAEGASWVADLQQRAPHWLAQLPWLAEGSADPAGTGPLAESMLRQFGALLDARTQVRPLLLVIEDLHWSDHATIGLLGYLARRRGPARWMVVASFRAAEATTAEHPLHALRLDLRARRLCTELMLDTLTATDVDRYLERRFAPAFVSRRIDVAQALHAHTEGLPLFVVNVVDELVANGQLAQGPQGWSLAPDAWATLAVPDTITGVVERQIARLQGPERALLETASVLGFEFAHDVLAAVAGEPADTMQARCDLLAMRGDWLAAAGMAERGDGNLSFRYAFRHALYQRALYERSAPAQRLRRHLAAARALAEGARPVRHAAEIAHHFERTRDIALAAGAGATGFVAQARSWRLAAAREARALHALEDAIAQYTRALENDPAPDERARMLGERSELLRMAGNGPQALADSEAAMQLARTHGDAALRATMQLTHARICMLCDRALVASGLVDDLLAQPLSDDARAEAWLVKARNLRQLGQAEPAGAALEAALALVPIDDAPRRAPIVEEMVSALNARGALTEALPLAEEAKALYERCGDRAGAARALIAGGVLALNLNRTAQAEAALYDARQRLRALGDVDGQRSALLNLVKLHADAGDADAALALLDEGWRLAPQFESPVAECAFLNGFYYCNYLKGDLGAACRDAQRVLASAEGLSSVYWRVGSAALVADLFIFLGDWPYARQLMDDALVQLGERGEEVLRARVSARRAWIEVLAGQPAAALQRLDALDKVETPEDLAVIDRVRAQAHLELGAAPAALALLAPYGQAATLEAWAQILALRLIIATECGAGDEADLERAHVDLQNRCLPALEGLWLRRAYAAALAGAGRIEAARSERERYSAERTRLAATLAGWPERQASFLARFDPLE